MQVTPNTPYRLIPKADKDLVRKDLQRVNSPLLPFLDALYAEAPSALFWGQSWLENQHATTGLIIKAHHHNPLSIRPPVVGNPGPYASGVLTAPDGGQFEIYRTPVDCAREWKRRLFIEDKTYKDGVYGKTVTLRDMLWVYAPKGDKHPVTGVDNANIKYAETVSAVANRLIKPGTQPEVPVNPQPAAFAVIPVNKAMAPIGARNLPGTFLNDTGDLFVLVHETGNTSPGADARMHANFVRNGGGSSSVSFHFAVDEFGAYQMIPLDRLGYHASDGCDNRSTDWGCFRSVAIETCVHNGNAAKAKIRKNLATLIAMIITGHPSIDFGRTDYRRFSVDRIRTHHQSAADKKWCPTYMLNEGYVPVLVNDVKSKVAGQAGPIVGTLIKGDTVKFTDNLNIRREWNLNAKTRDGKPNVIATLPAGTVGTIIDGPNVHSGHTWWDLSIAGFGTGHVSGQYLEEIVPPRPEPVFKAPSLIPELTTKAARDSGAAWQTVNGIKFRGVWDEVEAIRDTPQLLYATLIPAGEPDGMEFCGGTIKKGERRFVTHMVEGTGTKKGEVAEFYYDEHGARLNVLDFKRVKD